MAYKFQSALFPNSLKMHQAMAQEWLSAGGSNSRRDMRKFLAEMTDAQLADDEISAWELGDNAEFDRDELLAAYADIRERFAEIFPE